MRGQHDPRHGIGAELVIPSISAPRCAGSWQENVMAGASDLDAGAFGLDNSDLVFRLAEIVNAAALWRVRHPGLELAELVKHHVAIGAARMVIDIEHGD